MKKLKMLAALLLAGVLAVSVTACGNKSEETKAQTAGTEAADDTVDNASADGQKSKIDEIKEAGVLVVGTSADYPPYEFHAEVDGKDTIVGFDMAFAKFFADSLGVELKIVDMNFDSLLISLDKGDFDIVLAGLTPNEERLKVVDFTDSIFNNNQVVIIRAEDADKFQSVDDLAGHKGGVQTGSVQVDIANKVIGEENVVGLVKFQDLIMELKSGKVDEVFTNSLIATAYLSTNEDLEVMVLGEEYNNKSGFAVAVQKGNEDFVAYLNEQIENMREQDLIDKYIAEAQLLAGIDEEE